jgi:hypothetical protein
MSLHSTKKKRAIYTGLYPYLESDNLMRAMVLWEQKYADNPSFAVQHFINDICIGNDLKSLRRDMLLNLVKTMVVAENELMPDPSAEISLYKKQNKIVASVEYTSRELIVFQKLIIGLLEQVSVDIRVNIKDYVLDNLVKSKIDSSIKRQLQLWLSKQVGAMKVAVPDIDDLRKVINFFYVGFCEYTGPVETDRILGKAVAKVTDNDSNEYVAIMRKLL